MRINLIPINIEHGNMLIPTHAMSVPKGRPMPSITGSVKIGNPSSSRIPLPINSNRGSILNQVLIILPEVLQLFSALLDLDADG